MSGILYMVATPIGNLGDMTPRAVEVLREADIIAAEDTRNSMTLLSKFEIKTKLASNHKFNEASFAERLVDELLQGKNVAVISDAGTPCVSDPGSALVRLAAKNDIEVVAIPGACAVAAAVSVSGFDGGAFVFLGFFPRESGEIKKMAEKLEKNAGVYVFYESPKRIIKTIEVFFQNFPDCEICLCNDLTKKFERAYRGSPAEILEKLNDNPSAQKGEYTLVANIPAMESPQQDMQGPSIESIIVDVMAKRKCTAKDAVKHIASEYGFGKNEIYAASLNLKKIFRE